VLKRIQKIKKVQRENLNPLGAFLSSLSDGPFSYDTPEGLRSGFSVSREIWKGYDPDRFRKNGVSFLEPTTSRVIWMTEFLEIVLFLMPIFTESKPATDQAELHGFFLIKCLSQTIAVGAKIHAVFFCVKFFVKHLLFRNQ
jgi:hypothetical protein